MTHSIMIKLTWVPRMKLSSLKSPILKIRQSCLFLWLMTAHWLNITVFVLILGRDSFEKIRPSRSAWRRRPNTHWSHKIFENAFVCDLYLGRDNKYNFQERGCDSSCSIPNCVLSLKREQESRLKSINSKDARNLLALFLVIWQMVLSKISMKE